MTTYCHACGEDFDHRPGRILCPDCNGSGLAARGKSACYECHGAQYIDCPYCPPPAATDGGDSEPDRTPSGLTTRSTGSSSLAVGLVPATRVQTHPILSLSPRDHLPAGTGYSVEVTFTPGPPTDPEPNVAPRAISAPNTGIVAGGVQPHFHVFAHLKGYLPESDHGLFVFLTREEAAEDCKNEADGYEEAGYVVVGSPEEGYDYGWEKDNLFGAIYIEECNDECDGWKEYMAEEA